MLDLILIIMLIVSLSKPDVLLAKKLREKANEDQKKILVKNLRKIYVLMIATFESIALIRYTKIVGIVLAVIFVILFIIISIPAIKENRSIIKEING